MLITDMSEVFFYFVSGPDVKITSQAISNFKASCSFAETIGTRILRPIITKRIDLPL